VPRKIEDNKTRVQLVGGVLRKPVGAQSWVLDFYKSGKRQRESLFASKAKSLERAQEILTEKQRVERGDRSTIGSEVGLDEVVAKYLEKRRGKLPQERQAEPRKDITYRNDEDRLNQIVAALPAAKVKDLRKEMCIDFIRQKMKTKSGTNDKKFVSRTTASKPVLLLVSALRYAASNDICFNPLDGMVVDGAKGSEIRKKRRPMTVEEYKRFAAAAVELDVQFQAGHKQTRVPQAPLYLAIYSAGRRLGEMLDLEWPDVHLEAEPATWDFWDTKGQKIARDENGPETYPIPADMVKYLKGLKGFHARLKGRPVGAGDKVFVAPNGSEIDGARVRRHFRRIMKRAKIDAMDHRGRSLDLHAARKTVYDRCSDADIPVDQAMYFVGHKDIRTAMKHYKDPNAKTKAKVSEKLSEALVRKWSEPEKTILQTEAGDGHRTRDPSSFISAQSLTSIVFTESDSAPAAFRCSNGDVFSAKILSPTASAVHCKRSSRAWL